MDGYLFEALRVLKAFFTVSKCVRKQLQRPVTHNIKFYMQINAIFYFHLICAIKSR
jgi:hypothetical protein